MSFRDGARNKATSMIAAKLVMRPVSTVYFISFRTILSVRRFEVCLWARKSRVSIAECDRLMSRGGREKLRKPY